MPPRKAPTEQLDRIPVASAVVMSPIERAAALGLLAFGITPLIVTWIRLLTLPPPFDQNLWINLNILGAFLFVAIETISLIVLRGFRRIDLSDSIMKWLGGAALLDVGGLTWYIVKHLK